MPRWTTRYYTQLCPCPITLSPTLTFLLFQRIKANQIHKLLREEKDVLGDQVATYQTQVDAQNQVVRKLEEKERILQNALSTVEKEMGFRQQGSDLHKRKVSFIM